MRECENCGSSVSDQFARVFGDNENRIHGCPFCESLTACKEGCAADPDSDSRSHGTVTEGRFA